MEPSTHGRLWNGAHRLFGAVEHLQLANSYGLFRRMTGVGGRPEVVLEGSYDRQHWTVSTPHGRGTPGRGYGRWGGCGSGGQGAEGGGKDPGLAAPPTRLGVGGPQEIEFMYKPGNVSRPPPLVAPHQPRLDWQMWFAALGPHTHSPWFTSLVLCLLQGSEPGEAGPGAAGQGGLAGGLRGGAEGAAS